MSGTTLRIPCFVLLLGGLSGACGVTPRPADDDFLLGGIQVNEPDLDGWLDALEAADMNAVSVTCYARQGDWDTDQLTFDPEDDGIVPEIRAAKARGLHVVLILRVALDSAYERNRFLWHGMIAPRTDALLDGWFERYGAFAEHWAAIAEREGVDVLMIASEMNSLTSTAPLTELPALESYYLDPEKQIERKQELAGQESAIADRNLWLRDRESFASLAEYAEAKIAAEADWASRVATDGGRPDLAKVNRRRGLLQDHWVALIDRLRGLYRGRLGYAANFDQYREVAFWDRLDLMGINAYFPLRHTLLPTRDPDVLYAALEDGWREVLGAIRDFRRAQGLEGRSLIFTELGYTYRANSTIEPWADTGFSSLPTGDGDAKQLVVWQEQPVDHLERALAVRALWDVHRRLDAPLLGGILYWKLSTVPSHRDVEAFVLLLGSQDPLAAELRRFREPAAPGPS